jgi:lysylphosphatidylglycerol synthetase-like protein (DUF2156 family)
MMTTPFSSPISPTRPSPDDRDAGLGEWLDRRQRDLTHPKVVEEQLRRAGWHPMPAAIEANRYRSRFNEHPLGYAALLVSTGVAALAVGTVGHALASAIGGTVDRNSLTFWLTIALVALPFAVWAHVWAAHVDRDDPVAVWSQSRKTLAQALIWGCGLVGIGRLAFYGAQLIGALIGATWAIHHSALAGLVNVAITVAIALPLGLWAFHFLHRFDDEDPTRAPEPRRRHR